jgi:hypothetical protein
MSGAIHVMFVVNIVTKRQVSLRVLLSYYASFILLIPHAHSSTVLGMDNGQLKVAVRQRHSVSASKIKEISGEYKICWNYVSTVK